MKPSQQTFHNLLSFGFNDQVLTNSSLQIQIFQTSLKIYEKFDLVWTKTGIENHMITKSCSYKIKQIGWLLYIILRNQIFDRNLN